MSNSVPPERPHCNRGTTFDMDHNEGAIAMTSVLADGTIEFRFFRPSALSVGVAGDFNGWRGAALEMEREEAKQR